MTFDGEPILLWFRTNGLRVVFILAGAFLTIRLLYLLINRIERIADDGDPTVQSSREKRAATITSILKQITWIGITGMALMMVLREFGVDIAPIIAGAGILGLAVGFGAQSLVKDVISGFFILVENQFDVGDVVSGAGVSGSVERMNLRFTQLRDLQGRVHFIPNGEFRVVSNLTRNWSRALVDINVAYNEDVDRVQGVLKEIGAALKADPAFGGFMLEPLEILGIDSFTESAVTLRTIIKTTPGKQWMIAREFRRRVKVRFDELGIEIPLPQRVVQTRVVPARGAAASNDAGLPPATAQTHSTAAEPPTDPAPHP